LKIIKTAWEHDHDGGDKEPFTLGFHNHCYSAVFPVFPTVSAWFAIHSNSLQITTITGKVWAKCGHGLAWLTRPSAG
ncbi:MAG: hypothetical protein ACLSGC_10165, partial [Bifidobacterium pseudocatenulatum]